MAATRSRDLYQLLGVNHDATPEELKAAFRKLASLHHPDRNPGDDGAQERFKEINAADQILSDPQRRAAYDRFGDAAVQPGSPFASSQGVGQGFEGAGIEDLLGSLFGAFGFQKGARGDLRKEVVLDFQEAAFGCSRQIVYDRTVSCATCHGDGSRPGTQPETCVNCGGRGRVRFTQGLLGFVAERPCSHCNGRGSVISDPCQTCRGMGIVAAENTLEVSVPAGIEEGATTLVQGAGNVPRAGKAAGDLELIFRVEEHPFFKRVRDDVLCVVPISFTIAALGGEVEVPTLDGKAKVRVPQGTQPGAVLRLKGKGVPKRSGGRGDQRVEVLLEVPTQLSAKQRALLEELSRELGEEVMPQRRTFVEKLKDLFG
ncbi:MAG: molecular chaperone DnaJ [Polyangiales bacterium]